MPLMDKFMERMTGGMKPERKKQMMEHCLSSMSKEQREQMFSFCRGMIGEMEEKFSQKSA